MKQPSRLLVAAALLWASACASANHAMGLAMRSIKMGDADMMLTGGAEATITPLGIAVSKRHVPVALRLIKARAGVNPATGAKIRIPAKKVFKFSASKNPKY